MNSLDLDDDEIVALEPPLGSRSSSLSANTRQSPRNAFQYNNHAYGRYTDDDDGIGGGYDSDRIDPELEELLYASVHHQTVNSMELSFDVASKHDTHQQEPSNETPVKSDAKPSPETTPEKIPASHDGFAIFNNRKSVKKELKDIKRAKKVATDAATAAAQFTIDERASEKEDLDLSFGYLVNGTSLETTLDPIEAMNKFYNEDDYDSDDERRRVKRMSSDRRFWKINQEDLLANMRRRSGSSRGRNQQCRSCGGYGHLVKECPRREVCFICGDSRHVGQKCPCRVCSICFLPGHLSFKCPVRYDLKGTFCGGCRQPGHKEENCTQNWRKFLAVTDAPTYLAQVNNKCPLAGDTVTVNEIISCSNCGSRGQHFACECPQKTMDNLRFQIPAPVMNWRAIRKEAANHRSARLPKGRPRKSLPQPGSFTSMPSASATSSSSSYQNGYSPHKAAASASKFPNTNANKRPWNQASSSPELITLDSDSDADSDDSVQYVLSLLKNSTQANDSPLSHEKKRYSAKDKHPYKASKATATASESSILNISTKKKKNQNKKQWPKKQKKAATFNSTFTPSTPQFVGVQASKGRVATPKPKFKKKKPKTPKTPSTPLMEAAKILAVSHMKRRLSSKKSKQIAKLKATAKKH